MYYFYYFYNIIHVYRVIGISRFDMQLSKNIHYYYEYITYIIYLYIKTKNMVNSICNLKLLKGLSLMSYETIPLDDGYTNLKFKREYQ